MILLVSGGALVLNGLRTWIPLLTRSSSWAFQADFRFQFWPELKMLVPAHLKCHISVIYQLKILLLDVGYYNSHYGIDKGQIHCTSMTDMHEENKYTFLSLWWARFIVQQSCFIINNIINIATVSYRQCNKQPKFLSRAGFKLARDWNSKFSSAFTGP